VCVALLPELNYDDDVDGDDDDIVCCSRNAASDSQRPTQELDSRQAETANKTEATTSC